MREKNYTVTSVFTLDSIGVITFIVFLVLKLCNVGNPAFDWLTWFWVWFPLWLPVAISLGLLIIGLIIFIIISKIE